MAALMGSPLGGIVLGVVFAHEKCLAGTEICTPHFNSAAAAYSTLLGWALAGAGIAYFWLQDARREAELVRRHAERIDREADGNG